MAGAWDRRILTYRHGQTQPAAAKKMTAPRSRQPQSSGDWSPHMRQLRASAAFDETDDEQHHKCADRRRHDGGQPPRPKCRKAQHAPKPGADECTNDTDDDVADDAEAAALHDFAGEEAGNETDQQNDNQALRFKHVDISPRCARPYDREPGTRIARW